MPSAVIYKINKKGVLIHANTKVVSGFSVASEPFIQIAENNINKNIIADTVKSILKNDDSVRAPDPKNWNEFNKNFLKRTGLKSLKELDKVTTLCCIITNGNNNIIFTPTKHAEPPDKGFSHMGKKDEVVISYTSSDEEIFQALELAFSKCE